MSLDKITGENLRVNKTGKTGALYYSVWRDGQRREYIRIEANAGGGPNNGSFSRDAYSLDDIAISDFTGVDVASGARTRTSDNNMPGFLRSASADWRKRQSE